MLGRNTHQLSIRRPGQSTGSSAGGWERGSRICRGGGGGGLPKTIVT